MKKIVAMALALALLSAGVAEASKCSQSSSSSSKSALPLGSPISFTFMIVPKVLKLTSGHNELRLSASLAPAYNFRDAEIDVHFVKGKARFRYSDSLKRFMRGLSLKKADFKPLETYLKAELKKGKKNLLPFVTILATYLQSGQAPVFTLNFQQ